MRAKGPVRPLGLRTILPRVALDSSVAVPLAQVNQEPVTAYQLYVSISLGVFSFARYPDDLARTPFALH